MRRRFFESMKVRGLLPIEKRKILKLLCEKMIFDTKKCKNAIDRGIMALYNCIQKYRRVVYA